jgi:hypothetical protein
MTLLRFAAVLVLAVQPADALRTLTVRDDPEIATPKEIKAKWDKMDEFLGIMFQMACKWKHGKDVHGLAAEKFKDGDLANTDEVVEFKKKTQAENVVQLKAACGQIVAKGEKHCRQGCADGWGKAMGKRDECDSKCEEAYSKFEKSCNVKADNLAMVYKMNLDKASARKRCYEGHCKELPTVWLKESEADMKDEVKAQCDKNCDPEQITIKCERKWLLEVDFLRTSARSKCHDEGKVKECFAGKKETESAAMDKCKTDGLKTCDTQHKECETKSGSGENFKEAAQACEERKKMCEKQVSKNCLKDYDTALDAARAKCEEEDADALDKCEASALEAQEGEHMEKCEKETGPKCQKKCKDDCDVADMNGCLANLGDQGDPAADFCADFWRLLHESSEVDPVSGDPIVLLAKK